MLHKSSFEDKAVRPDPLAGAGPETLRGPALVVCRKCLARTNWFGSTISAVCPCGGRVEKADDK